MKRSPFKIVMVVLGYLAAGAVVNVVVAAGCALWMPISPQAMLVHGDLPDFAVKWTPINWLSLKYDPASTKQDAWCKILGMERRGTGVRFVEVQARFDRRGGYHEPPFENFPRFLLLRVGWPSKCLEAASGPEVDPMYCYLAAAPPCEFRSAVCLPWQRASVDAAPRFAFPNINLSNVTRNFIPLSPIWPAMIGNTVVWALILAFFVYAPRRLRAEWRLHHGVCPRCAYPIGVSAKCTECGHALPRAPVQVGTP